MIRENTDYVLSSNNFAQQVKSGHILKRDDFDCDPVLQKIDASTKFRKSALNSSECAQKQATLQASDKSGHHITTKFQVS